MRSVREKELLNYFYITRETEHDFLVLLPIQTSNNCEQKPCHSIDKSLQSLTCTIRRITVNKTKAKAT